MQLITIILLSLGLATDALTVSICNGVGNPNMTKKKEVFIPSVFAIMQGLMPLIGFFIGGLLLSGLEQWFSVISFVILNFLGLKMIFSKDTDDVICELTTKEILLQGIATSIDALVVGLVFSQQNLNLMQVFLNISIIAIITFILCLIGIIISRKIGKRLNENAKIVGGIMLIIVALIILVESFLSL